MDLSNLIATIVTSTAALIAIIGGFLISRVITLASEQSGIRRRLREIRNDIFAKNAILQELESDLLEEDGIDFIEEHYKELVFEKKSISDILKEEEGYRGREIKELEPYVQELQSVYQDVYELTDKGEKMNGDFKDFLESHELKYARRKDWYELLFDELEKIEREKQKEREKALTPWAQSFPRYDFQPPIRTFVNDREIERYQRKKRDCARMRDDLTVLQLQYTEQNKIFEDYGKPKGLWWGLFVLAYASVAGIAYPVALLPYEVGIYNDVATKKLLLGLFYSQLAVLFIYLGIYMSVLTRKEPEPPLNLHTNNSEDLIGDSKTSK